MLECGVEACADDCGGPVVIKGPYTQNCVCTSTLLRPPGEEEEGPPDLNMAQVALLMYGSCSKQRANLNGYLPHFSIKLHPTVANTTGSRSHPASYACLHVFRMAMNTKLRIPRTKWVRSGPLQIHTEMATCYITRRVNLEAFHSWATSLGLHPVIDTILYTPRNFVGLRVRIKLDGTEDGRKVTFTVYRSGSIVITGAKTATVAREAIDKLFPVVSQFVIPFKDERDRDLFEAAVAVERFENGKHRGKEINRMRATRSLGDPLGLNGNPRVDKRARNIAPYTPVLPLTAGIDWPVFQNRPQSEQLSSAQNF